MLKANGFICLEKMNGWIFKNLTFLMSSMIFVFFLLELINRVYFIFFPDSKESLSFYPKMFLQLLFVIPVLYNYKSQSKESKYFIITSAVIMLIGVIRFYGDLELYVNGIKHFNKLVLYFFVYLFFFMFNPKSKTIFKVFEWILIVNAVLILIGLLTGFEHLKSYPFTQRFGYSGVFSRHAINDVSLFYLVGVFYMFIRWKRKETTTVLFFLVFISSFFVGTKAIYLQNIILTVFVIFSYKALRNKVLIFFLTASLVLLLVYNFSFWDNLLKTKGIFAVLSSLRTDLLLQKLPLAIAEGTPLNLLFGFSNPFPYFVEMDFFDMIFTIGIIGTGLIFYFYFRVLFALKTNDKAFHYLFMATFFLMVLVSGRYTYSGMNVIYLPLFLYYLGNETLSKE